MTAEDPKQAMGQRRVGRYHLVKRLAVGGMAEVFLATDQGFAVGVDGPVHPLGRLVVIKRILPHLVENGTFVEMFLHEARTAAKIAHPNVVKIFELGESGGFPFIAMEYVPGSTLKQLVRAAREAGTPIPVDVAVHLLAQACAGAHAAHELVDARDRPYALVHRDLTPHNLMVTDRGHVKLLDFGIAKATTAADQTRTGMLKGKIGYMSPEQCRQEQLDRRSDIFSLGICGWELLAGRKPFSGKSELATMQAIVLGKLPHLREVRPDVPEPIAAAIHRALALDPDHRHPTADDLRRALRDAARIGGLTPDEDVATSFLRSTLGDQHAARSREVDAALERTLVSLSVVKPSAPAIEGDPSTETEESAAIRRSAATAGIALSLGLLAFGGVVVGVGALAGVALALGGWRGGPRGEPLVIAMAPTLDPDLVVAEHEPVRRYLERVLSRPVRLAVAPSYEAAAEDVLSGRAPYAVLPHHITLEAARRAPLEVLVTKVVDGSASSDAYLVVPRESPARTVNDLAGGVLCYSDPGSHTGYAMPRAWLSEQGLDPDTHFEPHFSGNHIQLLRDLVDGTCAVGGTYSNNYITADQRGIPTARLRILAVIGSTPHDALVAGSSAEPAVTDALRDALVAFDPTRDAGTPRVGETERITGFVEP